MTQKCEWCGRFGARRFVSLLRGVASIGNPKGIMHLWLCRKCEVEQVKYEKEKGVQP
jgi:ribosomal protein L37AE/L43A